MLLDMPVGDPTFESNPDFNNPEWFGFIKAKIKTPITKYPVLPIRLIRGLLPR